MDQSTKLFLVLFGLFIVFTTLNGSLSKLLSIVFGPSK